LERIMRRFDWVWSSTDTQVTTALQLYRDASLLTKMLGRYKFPSGTSHISGYVTPWMRVALIFVSEGALSIGDGRLSFQPERHRMFGWRMVNVRSDLAFDLPVGEIDMIEAADFSSPVAHLFDIPFTRVRTRLSPPLDNFLLCVGGRINMRSIRAQSIRLRSELLQLTEKTAG
jgi:hypothetical protein